MGFLSLECEGGGGGGCLGWLLLLYFAQMGAFLLSYRTSNQGHREGQKLFSRKKFEQPTMARKRA